MQQNALKADPIGLPIVLYGAADARRHVSAVTGRHLIQKTDEWGYVHHPSGGSKDKSDGSEHTVRFHLSTP